MKCNPAKCKALSVTNQHNILHNLPFTVFNNHLSNSYIDYVHSQVDLGVTINHKLNWNTHCEKLVNKASSQLGVLIYIHYTPAILLQTRNKRKLFTSPLLNQFLNIVQ